MAKYAAGMAAGASIVKGLANMNPVAIMTGVIGIVGLAAKHVSDHKQSWFDLVNSITYLADNHIDQLKNTVFNQSTYQNIDKKKRN